MKIGIITFHSAHNYGAVLQAWSLQEYLKQQGNQVEIVNLRLPVIDKLYRLTYRTHKKVTGYPIIDKKVNGLYYDIRAVSCKLRFPAKYEKFTKFEHFINRVLPVTEEAKSYEQLCSLNLHYDALIVGSDQVWNGILMKGINPAYFLQFGNSDALRISYAASIGTSEIPPKYRLAFKRYLREFDAISVREQKAKEQVEQLTDQPVDLVADPTFLLEKEDFDRLKKKPKISKKYIYVHNVHLKRVDEALNSVAEEMSKRLNLPIIHNWSEKIYEREAGHFTGGIEEFIGLVSEAECVITNSFHCTVFSIIYHRNFITVPHFKHPDRMKFLLSELGISEHLIARGADIPEDISQLEIDYQKVEERKMAMGDYAREFLQQALIKNKKIDNRNYFASYGDVFRCYGCGACRDICPENAITMEADEEGFLYPIVDAKKCIRCGTCGEICIYHKEGKIIEESVFPQIYVAYHKNQDVVAKSSAGGIFSALCHEIIKKDGNIAGVMYDKKMQVVYAMADTLEKCKDFCGSKYISADNVNILKQTRELLERKKTVLFSGTPCQIAGLKAFLGKSYDTLYTVEINCHGVGSPKVFEKYKAYLENIYQSPIVRFEFDNKFKGAESPFVLVEFASGSTEVELAFKHNLSKAYLKGNILRPSCYTCEYIGKKKGVADITLGRFLGAESLNSKIDNANGVSMVKINTEKGKKLFDQVKNQLQLVESSYKEAVDEDQEKPVVMTTARSKLFYYLDDQPIDLLLQTFNPQKKGGIKGL